MAGGHRVSSRWLGRLLFRDGCGGYAHLSRPFGSIHLGKELMEAVTELGTSFDRQGIEIGLGLNHGIKSLGVSLGHLSKITKDTLTAVKGHSVTVLVLLEQDMDINRIGVGLDKTIEIFFTGFNKGHNTILIELRGIKGLYRVTGIRKNRFTLIILSGKLHNHHPFRQSLADISRTGRSREVRRPVSESYSPIL